MNIPDRDPYDFGMWHFILRLPVMILFTLFYVGILCITWSDALTPSLWKILLPIWILNMGAIIIMPGIDP